MDLSEYGWIKRRSGRFVHPSFTVEGSRDRLRVFTEAEALTLTEAALPPEGACVDCGTVHEGAEA